MTKIVHRIDDADREQILLGIVRKQPLKRIAERMNRHLSSITNEIKRHRVFIRGSYYAGNDCRYAEGCDKRNVCGDENCKMYCYTCPKKCHEFCNEYVTLKCKKYEKPPYVCNSCDNRRYCQDDRFFYDSAVANRQAKETRKTSRQGIHLTDEAVGTLSHPCG